MTKADLALALHETRGFTKKEASRQIEALIELIKETLATGEKVKIAGFGVFEINQKKPRLGRKPQTGEAITIKARRVLTFKPSNVLRDAINR